MTNNYLSMKSKQQIIIAAFLCSILAFTSCGSSDESVETETVENTDLIEPSAGISPQDSADVNSIIAELKGIEKFAVRDNYDLLLALMQHNGDERADLVKTIIEKQELDYYHTYSIIELDAGNGYIQYAPVGAEVTYTMTYWNMEDGSQLIATEAWGCGPICESDLTFSKFQNGVYELLENKDVIPEIEILPSWLVSDYDPNGEEPIEFRYHLPKKGKDIEFCLEDNCVNLVLENGKFKGY